jgi:hypothetical protein
MPSDADAAADLPADPPLPLGLALAITAGVIVAVAGFVALGAWLHVGALYAGFLLLWVWSTLDNLALKALPAALAGALTGAALSFLLQTGTAAGSMPLVVLALALMIVAVFLVVAKRAAGVCNASTMLFITVLNAPLLQAGEDFRMVIAGIALGAVWFGMIAWLIVRVVPGAAASAGGGG